MMITKFSVGYTDAKTHSLTHSQTESHTDTPEYRMFPAPF